MGQIEKAFLMISVAENDRDALPLLWFDDPMHEDPQLIALRFARVAFQRSLIKSIPLECHPQASHFKIWQ